MQRNLSIGVIEHLEKHFDFLVTDCGMIKSRGKINLSYICDNSSFEFVYDAYANELLAKYRCGNMEFDLWCLLEYLECNSYSVKSICPTTDEYLEDIVGEFCKLVKKYLAELLNCSDRIRSAMRAIRTCEQENMIAEHDRVIRNRVLDLVSEREYEKAYNLLMTVSLKTEKDVERLEKLKHIIEKHARGRCKK